MTPALSYFCGISATIFVAVGIAMAAIRWFHLCRPYDSNPRYYYPARPYVTLGLLSTLFLVPYIVSPNNPDAWFLVRLYFLPCVLYSLTILLFGYFGGVMRWRKWRVPMLIFGIPVAALLLTSLVLSLVPGRQIPPSAVWIIYFLGGVNTCACLVAIRFVLRWARPFDEDDFSNPADFPVNYAHRWGAMVRVSAVLCWLGTLSANEVVMAVLMIIFAIFLVLFILTALHPHRNGPVEEEQQKEAQQEKAHPKNPSQTRILSVINTVIVKQEAYLEPHLTIQDVADRSGYSRSHIAGLFKQEYGGFFNYVNRLRLQHVQEYMQEHPVAPLQEALEASGFNSRQTYYAVKARLGE